MFSDVILTHEIYCFKTYVFVYLFWICLSRKISLILKNKIVG